MSATFTPQLGKRYVTRGGWITPPIVKSESEPYPFTTTDRSIMYSDNGRYSIGGQDDDFDLVAEYVEPTTDTFRRGLIARIYCELVMSTEHQYRSQSVEVLAKSAISIADTLIEAMEATQ